MMYRQTYRQNVNNNKNKKIICIPCTVLFCEFKKKKKKTVEASFTKMFITLKVSFYKDYRRVIFFQNLTLNNFVRTILGTIQLVTNLLLYEVNYCSTIDRHGCQAATEFCIYTILQIRFEQFCRIVLFILSLYLATTFRGYSKRGLSHQELVCLMKQRFLRYFIYYFLMVMGLVCSET